MRTTATPNHLRRAALVLIVIGAVVAALTGVASTAEAAGSAGRTAYGASGMSPNLGAAPSAIAANEQTAFAYFRGKGLTSIQTAGVIGNLDQESGMDPTIHQIGGGPGRGIAQWSAGGRWDTDSGDNVLAYAAQQGASATSLSLQLSFVWYELTSFSNYGLSQLRSATTITSAVVAFQDHFEGCGQCDSSQRVQFAQSAYDRYGSTPPPPPSVASSGSSAVKVGNDYHVFWTRPSDGHMLQSYWTGSWSTQDLGGVLSGTPAVTYHDNRYDVFAVAPSGALYQKTHTTAGWDTWHAITTGWTPDVSAVWTGTEYHVFGHNSAGHLLQAYYTGSWHVQDLGGITRGTPGVTYHDNRYDVFAVAPSGHLYQTTHTTAGWDTWHDISAGPYKAADTGGVGAVYVGTTYHVFPIGTTGHLEQVTHTTAGWNTPQDLGGILSGSPGITYAASRYDAFAPANNHLYQTTYTPSTSWTAWHSIA